MARSASLAGRNARFKIGSAYFPYKDFDFEEEVEDYEDTDSECTVADTAADSGTSTFEWSESGITKGSGTISGSVKAGAPILAALKRGNVVAGVVVELSRATTPDVIKFGYTGPAASTGTIVAGAGIKILKVSIKAPQRGLQAFSISFKTQGPYILPW